MFSLKVHPSIPFGKLFEIICFLYHFLRQHEFKAAENWIEQKKMKLAKKKEHRDGARLCATCDTTHT